MSDIAPSARLIDLTTDIVSAYVANNSIDAASLPTLIASIHAALGGAGRPQSAVPEPLVPAVPIRKSITPDHLICLEDGRPFKSLKRHLMTKYSLSPAAYREKWGLPADYPMVAPAYAQARSNIAKAAGLGQAKRKPRSRAPAKKIGIS